MTGKTSILGYNHQRCTRSVSGVGQCLYSTIPDHLLDHDIFNLVFFIAASEVTELEDYRWGLYLYEQDQF